MSETNALVLDLLDRVKQKGLDFSSYYYRFDGEILRATFNTKRGNIVTAFAFANEDGRLTWGNFALPYPVTIAEFA